MGDVPLCSCCSIVASLDSAHLVDLGRHWTLNRNVHAARPAMVLQTRRHVGHLGDLTRPEADGLAQILPALEASIRHRTRAVRVHVLLLAESAPHVHWHVIPRYEGDLDGVTGVGLLQAPPPTPEPEGLLDGVASDVTADSNLVGRRAEPSPVVRWVVAALHQAQRLTLYDPLLRRWRTPLPRDPRPPRFPALIESGLTRVGLPRGDRSAADAATVYVGIWLLTLLVVFAAASVTGRSWLAPIVTIIAAYRAADIFTFQVRYLLDRRASVIASFERTLLFLAANLFELVLAMATILIALDARAPGLAIREAFGTVTLTDAPKTPSDIAFVLRVGFTAASIALLVGAGGIVLGLVGRDVDEAPPETKPRGISSDDG